LGANVIVGNALADGVPLTKDETIRTHVSLARW
jgi:hypothetical protein